MCDNRNVRVPVSAILFVAFLLRASIALAQEGAANIDRARSLARESADLLEQGRYAEALDRATRAEALYHAPLHIAVEAESLEGLGRLVEAAAKYEELVAEPLTPSASRVFRDAQQRGRARLQKLLSRVPSLLIVARGAAGATATVDGKPFALETGIAVRLDPGEHEVRVSAGGFRPFAQTVTLPARGGVVVLEAALAPENARSPAPTVPPPAPADAPTRPGSRVPAVIAFAIGGTGLAIGAVTGGVFLTHLGQLEDSCPQHRCPPGQEPQIASTRALGNAATVGFVVGAAGVAAGTVLLFVRPGKRRAAAITMGPTLPDPRSRLISARVFELSPWIGASSAGLRGTF
jgi:hypothetical protein